MPSGPGTYGSKRGRPPMKMKVGGAPKTSKRPVTREDAKRLAAKRKRVSESPGMTKRMNVSGATGNKGSRYGAEETANRMATDPARGGVDPREERAKKKSKGNFDFMLKNSKGGKIAKKKAGGKVMKKMGGGKVMKKMGGGTLARGSGAARPQKFRKNG